MEEFSISKIYDLSLETLKNIYNSFKFLNISETNFKRIAIEEIVDKNEEESTEENESEEEIVEDNE